MKNWSTSGKPLTTSDSPFNKSLFEVTKNEDGTSDRRKVTREEVEAAFKDLSATGFWVTYKSRHLKGKGAQKVARIDDDAVHTQGAHDSTTYSLPKSLFHQTFELAD